MEQLRAKVSKQEAENLIEKTVVIKGINVLVTEVNTTDINNLRSMADIFRDKLGSAVVVLGAKMRIR